jgi:hypothetical protein
MEFDNYGAPKSKGTEPNVRFYVDEKEDKVATHNVGFLQYRSVEMCEIRFPADRQRTLVRPAHAECTKINGRKITYADRFPDAYQRFKQGLAPVVSGMPLAELGWLDGAKRKTLNALGIYTVEQLASLEGTALSNLGMGGREIKEKAKAFLENARDSSTAVRLAAEVEALKAQLAQVQSEKAEPTGYAAMSDDDLKELIASKTGSRPRGNPSHDTLVRMAHEVESGAAA